MTIKEEMSKKGNQIDRRSNGRIQRLTTPVTRLLTPKESGVAVGFVSVLCVVLIILLFSLFALLSLLSYYLIILL